MMTPPIPLPLGSAAKLSALRRLDSSRPWKSLDDTRRCLQCGRQFTGRDIQIIFLGERGAILRAHCPTASCEAPVNDWVLPREQVYIPGAEEKAVQPPLRFFR